MDFEILRKNEQELELIFDNTTTTFIDPIVSYILEVDKSAFATYVLDHPIKGPLRLIVRTEKGDPAEVISKAIDKLGEDIEEIGEGIAKEIGKR